MAAWLFMEEAMAAIAAGRFATRAAAIPYPREAPGEDRRWEDAPVEVDTRRQAAVDTRGAAAINNRRGACGGTA